MRVRKQPKSDWKVSMRSMKLILRRLTEFLAEPGLLFFGHFLNSLCYFLSQLFGCQDFFLHLTFLRRNPGIRPAARSVHSRRLSRHSPKPLMPCQATLHDSRCFLTRFRKKPGQNPTIEQICFATDLLFRLSSLPTVSSERSKWLSDQQPTSGASFDGWCTFFWASSRSLSRSATLLLASMRRPVSGTSLLLVVTLR